MRTCYEIEKETVRNRLPFEVGSVRYVPERTCRYFPEVGHSYFDENDVEHDTDEADTDGCNYFCSNCGCTMLGGDLGWFDETEGEHGGLAYKPRFDYCPYCGAKVVA